MTTKLDRRPAAPSLPRQEKTTPGSTPADASPARAALEQRVRETVNRMVARDGFAALVDGGAPILRALGVEHGAPPRSGEGAAPAQPTRGLNYCVDGDEG